MDISVWYLSTCSTCRRIMKEAGLDEANATLIDIKKQSVAESELEDMYAATGSYRELINGRSTQFRTMEKKARDLTENEARELLLQHYAFLKRPVVRVGTEYFVGNSKKNVISMIKKLRNE